MFFFFQKKKKKKKKKKAEVVYNTDRQHKLHNYLLLNIYIYIKRVRTLIIFSISIIPMKVNRLQYYKRHIKLNFNC